MRLASRAALAVSGIALLLSFVLGLLPTRGEAIVSFQPPATEKFASVNCGAVFSSNKWSGTDGCEAARLTRWGHVALALVTGIVVGVGGVFALAMDSRGYKTANRQ